VNPVNPDLRAVLFGHPVSHSRSPELFRALAAAGGPAVDFQLRDVPPGSLGAALDGLRQGRWQAAGVTIPYKEEALAAVDEVVGVAVAAGSINAVARRADGRLVGANTDGPGFLRALSAFEPALVADGALSVLMLGAGGAARGVGASLRALGARVIVVSRDPAARRGWVPTLADAVIGWDNPELIDAAHACQLIVQATPLGMSPRVDAAPPLPEAAILPTHRVVDLVYTPWETRFLATARARGARALNGWPMLVHQAAVALDFWLGAGAGAGLAAAVRRIEARDPSAGALERARGILRAGGPDAATFDSDATRQELLEARGTR